MSENDMTDREAADEEVESPVVVDRHRHRFVVSSDEVGERLDRLLARLMPELSRSRLSQLVEEGHVTVDDRVVRASLRVKADQLIAVTLPPPVPATPQPEAIDLQILYEDTDLLVVDKPAGMVVHPAAGVSSGTLVNALLHHVQDLAGIGGELRPGIVHRLDKETSGAIVVAKNEQALIGLQRAFQAHVVHKQYLALAHGLPPPSGTFDTPFGRHPVDRVRMTGRLSPTDPQARRAVTHFRTVEHFRDVASLVQVTLETGRTHQIRVHLSEAGFPLLADATYGGTRRDQKAVGFVRQAASAVGRQALHAQVLAFPHPRTGETIRCEAPVPPELQRAIDLLRAG